MKKRFVIGFVFLAALTSPVWFFVLKNEFSAFQLKERLGRAALPDGAKSLGSFSRVFNSGNGDGCDYEAARVIEYYGRVADLQDACLKLIGILSDEKATLGLNDTSAKWVAKISNLGTEISVVPNLDFTGKYLVTATTYARDVSPDFRCW